MNTTLPPPRANFFDASALVKIFAREADSANLQSFWNSRSPLKFTTPFCFYEALSILKGKWTNRRELTREQYLSAGQRLLAWFEVLTKDPIRVDLHDPIAFSKVRELAERHSIDLSDALQIVSVRDGRYSRLINESQTVLITADRGLAKAARIEGIRVWCCIDEPEP